MRDRRRLIGLALALMVSACGSARSPSTERIRATPFATPTVAPTPTAVPATPTTAVTAPPRINVTPPPADPSGVRVKLTKVGEFDRPIAMVVVGAAPWIVEKTGRIRRLNDNALMLDISSEVSTGSEQGLLGAAASPDGAYLYVNFTNTAGDTRVREYAISGGGLVGQRQVLAVDQPYANHNGGNLAFGPDGKLWIGLGDGGSAGDPQGNARHLGTLLGKMLRIDPRPSGSNAYGIPSDNPFVGRRGARGEIWAYGLRNPWRYSFDRTTGDLWIGDVGQGSWEEVDAAPRTSKGGENYGWDRYEGTHRFEGSAPSSVTMPVYEYSHDDGACSVTGGYVYRGSGAAKLQSIYVFADYCNGKIRGLAGGKHAFLGPQLESLSSFGEDAAGELYALSLSGGVFRIDPA